MIIVSNLLVIHAEMPVHEPGKSDPRGLQLWVDLPKQYKMVEPSYQELGPKEIPTAYPEGPNGPVKSERKAACGT